MRISEAAKKTGLSASNIRFYEKKKLLVAGREQQNEYRDYTDQDIECLKRIVVLRKAGLSIEEIRDIFDEKADVKTVLGEQQQKLQSQLQEDVYKRQVFGCLQRFPSGCSDGFLELLVSDKGSSDDSLHYCFRCLYILFVHIAVSYGCEEKSSCK